MAIPQLSTEQLQSARAAATEARRARAALKNQVKTGELSLSQALEKASGDDTLSRVKVVDLLRSLPRVGVTRSAEIMENLDIAANRRIRGLGRHQMERLTEMFS
ncbi:MAG: integration host factor, actinobacterial type [Arachnia sp.]